MADVQTSPLQRRQQSLVAKVKTKPWTAQPKKVQFVATEVRCQEKTRGGLCYEVILGTPEAKAIPPKRTSSPPIKNVSAQDIESKLRAAEERRQQLEMNKMQALSAKMMKIEEASRKKDELTSQFITNTREAMEQKMETHVGKRESYITDLKTKLKDHIENVEKTRLSIEVQTDEVRTAIEEKLKSASAHRDENIKKMVERLKEHEDQVHRVRTSNAVKFQQLETAVQDKLEHAQNRREQLKQEELEKLRNHNERTAEIKQNMETRKTEKSSQIETKLTTAEINREKEIQRKLENIKKNERRAETVRQNKANILANQETASSG